MTEMEKGARSAHTAELIFFHAFKKKVFAFVVHFFGIFVYFWTILSIFYTICLC